MKYCGKIIITPFLVLIKVYQYGVSPYLGANCRYTPNCSQYMAMALKSHGFFYGIYLGFKRIMRCHPWGGKEYDPIPTKRKLQ